MTDKAKALDRIRKCLALAGSSDHHEAAATIQRTKALMEKYAISDLDASLADIGELECRSGGKTTVPMWEAALAKSVGEALGCRMMFRLGGQSYVCPSLSTRRDYYRTCRENVRLFFIGAAPHPEIARSAFWTLRRQLHKARRKYKRRVDRNPRRVEAFVLGWVFAVCHKVEVLAAPLAELERVDAAIAARYGKSDKEAEVGKNCSSLLNSDPDVARHADRGMMAGRKVDLHSDVGLNRPAMLTGGCQ